MGILTEIKVLTGEGKLKDSAKESFINEVIEKAKKRKPAIVVGPAENPVLNLNIVDLVSEDTKAVFELYEQNHPGEERVEELLQEFKVKEGESIDDHKDRCPQYHNVYIEGIYANLATTFDVEDTAVLKAIGVEDPTQPIVDLIDNLKDTLEDVLQPILAAVGEIEDFITTNLDAVLAQIRQLQDFFDAMLAQHLTEALIEHAKEALETVFEALFGNLGEAYDNFIAGFNANADDIIKYLHEELDLFSLELPPLIPIKEENNGWLPPFSLPIPLPLNLDFLNFDWEGFDFDFPWFDWEDFFLMEVPPGLLEMMKNFFTGLFEAIVGIFASIVEDTEGFITALSQGVNSIVTYLIGIIVDPVIQAMLNAFPNIVDSLQHFSTFLVIIDKILPMIIIAVIGILIGSGLVAQSVAILFNLIE